MKAISQGDNTYDIYDDSLKVYNQLPSNAYTIRFSEKRGFFLEKHNDIEISESKLYGSHEKKVKKVIKSFQEMNRSLGVILSGEKGTGKSLFAKLLALNLLEEDIPVIIVDKYYPGIASYIENIEQETMILFDEFDKTFGEIKSPDGQCSPQSTLLTLFDGLSGGKKLYVITCNNLNKLSDYLVNRPGRFHYHLRFGYPSADEVREYLIDKLDPNYYTEIENVVEFSGKINLNYDCLRAICFELNHGLSFSEAIKDLNIVNIEPESYKIVLQFDNGESVHNNSVEIDMFEFEEQKYFYMYSKSEEYIGNVSFIPGQAIYDYKTGVYTIPGDKINFNFDDIDEYAFHTRPVVKTLEKCKPQQLLIIKAKIKPIHYTV